MSAFQAGYNFMARVFGQKTMVEKATAAGYKIGYERGYQEGLKLGYEMAVAERRAGAESRNKEQPSDYDRGIAEGISIGIAEGITLGIAQERRRREQNCQAGRSPSS